MNIQLIPIPSGGTILPIVLHGANRHPEVLAWNKRVMVDHFGIRMNYVEAPFPGVSHGWAMNQILAQTIDHPSLRPTYYWWLDNDALILTPRAFDHMLQSVRNKHTLWGNAWNSSHKTGPNGTTQHPYASQANLCFAADLYDALGRPDCDHHNPRSDTAEELTYAAEEKGYTVALQYPSSTATQTTALSQSCAYGRGNIYGPNLTYHESRADLPEHAERFIAMAQRVIAGEFGS